MLLVLLRSPGRRATARFVLLCLAWLSACLAGMAQAQPVGAAGFDDLGHTMYAPRQGAPSNVDALAQTPDGFLWLGTSEGLFRFDGQRFLPYRPPGGQALPDADVTQLLALPSGELWAGTRFGHVYAIRDGQLKQYGPASGLPAHSIFGLATDHRGRIWAATSFGVFYLDGERWHEVKTADGATLQVLGFRAFLGDGEGRLWAVASEAGVFSLEPGAGAFVKRRAASEVSGSLLLDTSGTAWIADDMGVAALSGPPRGIAQRALARLGSGRQATSVLRFLDSDGVLWGHSDGRLLRLPCAACGGDDTPRPLALQRWPRDRELSGSQFLSFFEDREGNLWIGTNGGLDRFRPHKFKRAMADGMPLADVAIAPGPDGRLMAGTHAMGLFSTGAAGTRREPFGKADDNFITSLYRARDGTLWVGGDGELHRSGPRGYEREPFLAAGENYEVQAMAEDREGGFWVSAALSALYRQKDGQWLRNGGLAGLPDKPPLSLASDEGQGLWLGYPGSLVLQLQGDRVRRWGPDQGLAVGNVLAFLQDGPRTWIGGATGLALYQDGRMRAVTTAAGEPIAGVSGLVRSADGELWLNAASGVMRVAADALGRVAAAGGSVALEAETFGVHAGVEGLPENLRPMPSAAATPDGKLWFATTSGLFWIDPRHVPRNRVAPQVQVLALAADGQAQPLQPELSLAAGTHTLQIDYTATSLSVPELVRFRYRLDGVDTAWQAAGARRQAFYTNLQPGRYQFHVAATNEDGVPAAADATVTFDIPPSFWQTGWFMALCALAALLLAWSLYRLRLGTLTRRVRMRFEERLRERERIARELHDTLLQGTQGLVLSFQVAASKLPRTDPRRQEMETILDRADLVVAEARDRVHGLRNPDPSEQDLVCALTAVGEDLAAASAAVGVRFEVQADEALPPLRADVLGEAFMAGREALANAFRHAQATSVQLEIRRDRRELHLRVRDDGKGLDAETLSRGNRPGHWGLVGMRERAEKSGGRLHIRSEPGQGTEVWLCWPCKVAFERPPGWLAPLRRRRPALP
ncbi:MAG TPA: two-component regulator propeller domain-containing protein [Ideonella sp.]|uniref:sensor histidine kinase n=1 Tax=Ideonella sp. TaxID=1929293 RepID=UPI002C86D884|nr:two-component regulator propeller domain-containing protein [Ideonella sp.]HSI50708.1 two-component regulator propeller domain-containing protein [Ideonella sp.]